ncbi:beta-lactamase [Exophiala aquamarina CBS 119918]|uniref:Beta-lactamase n=1 Tax=Exophiala aquamarina CBS 119918 TaxID=1182545 RepID=A0A072P9M5_9EURO|nr:beta-lactamase [Exophiala aquamarina CBS 119918]KEF56779.1 beta-lactamase [Exophiala aquamarina CBS 119918]
MSSFYLPVLLALFLTIYGVDSQACPPWVTSLITDALAQRPDFPGIQLAISSPRYGIECKTSIHSNATEFAEEPPLLVDTPWRIASITKTFTAVAALRLFEQKRLDLHAPIVNYLPQWAIPYLDQEQGVSNASKITSWMLLHHTSGLGDFASDPRWREAIVADPQYRWSQQAVLNWSATYAAPVGIPGAKYFYSDTGYTYLGLVIEHITQTGIAAAVRKLTRLDESCMPFTYWEILERTPQKIPPRAGQYYQSLDSTQWDASFDLYGAGGLVSNSLDLNHFAKALHGGQVLGKAAMELMYTTESSGTYGCGLVNMSYAGHQAWGHTGFWGAWSEHIPSLDLTVSGTQNQATVPLFDLNQFVQKFVQEECSPIYLE